MSRKDKPAAIKGRSQDFYVGNATAKWSLSLPENLSPGTIVSRISGKLSLEYIQSSQIWNVPDIEAAVNQPNAEIPLTLSTPDADLKLESAAIANNEVQLRLTGITHTGWAERNLRSSLYSLRLIDVSGHFAGNIDITEITRFRDGYTTNTSYVLNYTGTTKKDVPIAAGPIAMKWSLPASVRHFEVPFTLRDVRVP